jgi:hypothetical protein
MPTRSGASGTADDVAQAIVFPMMNEFMTGAFLDYRWRLAVTRHRR